MPGTASGGGPQQGSASSRNVNKAMAPVPPIHRESATNARIGSSSSVSYPDVTAGITDLYDPGNDSSQANLIEPDYPMDSLPRHASTRSLPTHETGITNPALRISQSSESNSIEESRNIPRNSPHRIEESRNIPRTSVRNSDPVQTIVPITSLSSSTGNPPVHIPVSMTSMSGRAPVIIPPQIYSMSHATHSLSPAVDVNINVSHAQTSVSGISETRPVRTQDINVGIVSRLDNQRQGINTLPDIVAHSQPPVRQSSSSQRPPVPSVDPRAAHSMRHSEPHARHRHRDHRHGGRSRRHSHRHSQATAPRSSGPCKESCYKCLAVGTSFRWILVVLSLLGVCCVVTGIVLAALHAAGNSFLFLAIMFIGLGVLLVVVVGVGWKCTPRGHEPLHALFNIGAFRHGGGGASTSSTRRHRHHRRDGRWHGGALYPEFQYRRPPPSYNASMQEYQQQLEIAHQNQTPDLYDPENVPDEDYSLPSSPPPSYRSRASTVRAGIQITFPPNQGGDYPDSRPPTYRSHPSGTLQGRHSRPSLSRDDDQDDHEDPAPADVAFTGSAVIVDTNTNQSGTNIQISPHLANQNVTVSVTTVSVMATPVSSSANLPPLERQPSAAPTEAFETVDPVGEGGADRVETAL